MRNIAFLLGGAAFVASAALVACSAPDPGVGNFGPRQQATTNGTQQNNGTSNSGGGSGSSSGSTNSGGGSGSGSGGGSGSGSGGGSGSGSGGGSGSGSGGASGGGVDAGGGGAADAGGGGGAIAPFTGATAYAANSAPTTSAQAAHQAAGQTAQTPTEACLGCHGPAATVPFLAAGFIATAAGGTTGATGVQVSVYNGNAAYTAYSDANGFFWINPPAAGATGSYTAGVREQTEVDMPQSETAFDCQSCHAGATGVIHYP